MTEIEQQNKFAVWHGISRSAIHWEPVIDENKCTGCGMCVVTCGEKRNVFGYDFDRHKAVVMYPENCMVGCNNCTVSCLWNAITHPDVSGIKEVVKSLTTEQLQKELKKKLSDNPSLLA
ncbi:ferredoxin family protein [Thermoplasma sp.]|uniref:4Fe-4S dicluster domain-containing protein n=1 Tax=Thermoplasma sp. TaxID=1973142 RepID=UPI00126E50F8|nr:ferredoxin family protein [Thermoplasma sp.]KAA8921945.1 MAG: ferredoxin family protein [Thermoplasma sp.]